MVEAVAVVEAAALAKAVALVEDAALVVAAALVVTAAHLVEAAGSRQGAQQAKCRICQLGATGQICQQGAVATTVQPAGCNSRRANGQWGRQQRKRKGKVGSCPRRQQHGCGQRAQPMQWGDRKGREQSVGACTERSRRPARTTRLSKVQVQKQPVLWLRSCAGGWWRRVE